MRDRGRSKGVSGVIAVDKPTGCTSRAVVDAVARLTRGKVGHAGTLDPLATGVLIIAVGSATRLISCIQQMRKCYVGQFRLGWRSDTDDSEGRITEGGDYRAITRERLEAACRPFVGTISQVPPRFSAIHVDGQRSYDLARRGEAVELKARPVEVFEIVVRAFAPPDFELEIACGSGTYIRSIGRDLGEVLGCGALMTGLRRTAVGPWTCEAAVPLESLDQDRLGAALQPPRSAVAHFPWAEVTDQEIREIRQGRPIPDRWESPRGTEVALIDEQGELIGLARVASAGARLDPYLVLPAAEPR